MSTLCGVLGRADPGNVALPGTWLGLTGQSHFSWLPSWTGRVDFCHSKDKRPGLELALTTQENVEMVKLLQGADRRSWIVGYAVLTPSQEAEIAEVGAGQYFVSSHSSFPSLLYLKYLGKPPPFQLLTLPPVTANLSEHSPCLAASRPRNSFISPGGGKIVLLFLCQA